jgi:hypothetical protein
MTNHDFWNWVGLIAKIHGQCLSKLCDLDIHISKMQKQITARDDYIEFLQAYAVSLFIPETKEDKEDDLHLKAIEEADNDEKSD